MSQPVQWLQPAVLRWARETSGMSVEDVARKMKRKSADISDWEEGRSAPSYPQLERLAYEIYRRPLAIFFFPEPPEEQTPETEFRSLPSSELEELSPDTLRHIRLAKAFQVSLRELHADRNPVQEPIFRLLNISRSSSVPGASKRIRGHLRVTLDDQRKARDEGEALKIWRAAIEEAGVHVFKAPIKQKRVSGFSLHDADFPLIYLNSGTSKTRQIFTALHELVHLLLGFNGMTTEAQIALGGYSDVQRRTEVFCNKVAAEVLLPEHAFSEEISRTETYSDEWVAEVARNYRVSREVVLRKLLDRGLISRNEYLRKAALWSESREKKAKKSGGGDYYNNVSTHLSQRYMKAVFASHYQGRLSADQVIDYLGVKTKGIAELESRVLGQNREP